MVGPCNVYDLHKWHCERGEQLFAVEGKLLSSWEEGYRKTLTSISNGDKNS